MIYDASLDELLQKIWEGNASTRRRRCGFIICRSKNSARWRTAAGNLPKPRPMDGRGNEIVTYIVDRNVNYTNVCNVYCKFCAFYRTEKDDDAYVITLEEMDKKIEETVALGRHADSHAGRPSSKAHQAVVSRFALAHQKSSSRRSTSTASAPASSSIFAKCSTSRWRKSSATSRPRVWAQSPAAAGKSSWTAFASAFLRSRR